MTCPPLWASSPRYIRAFQSRHTSLNLSRLPKLPEGTPPLISRRSTPGGLEFNVTSSRRWKTVDDDFTQAVRLESLAEKKITSKSGKKLSQKVARFPLVQLPSLDIRMVPKKMLVVKEQEQPPIVSRRPRKERSDLSLVVITPKATVHRFAVVRVRVKRRIVGALDLIVRRGVVPFPGSKPKQPNKRWESNIKGHKPDSEEPRVLLHDPTFANSRAWILPDWAYIIFPKAEVFKMPLPDLVDQIQLGLRQANQKAREWQDQYVSSETGEFIPLLSKGSPNPVPLSEPKLRKFQKPSRRPPDTWQGHPNTDLGSHKPPNPHKRQTCSSHINAQWSEGTLLELGFRNPLPQ
ncbi:hypothetical protein BDM02DRAFT_3187273 [Thelephora ganbajun]|uniref:Uncharacterized protein n=1 Tax=Thelephora ganbajun TaxID=370292 RepID=A0ACB6ZGQ8_THEGA|nr:hypothetical protein BDM02DRAFT_3187273 [Thelephora ganbajun]